MPKTEFYDIVKTNDLKVSIPQNSYFTIGTSPYYAHQHGLAIDIYHNLTLDNYRALSPISGKVLKIKHVVAPKPKFIGGVNTDYIMLISNPSNPKLVWKIMHVKPDVKIGDQIKIGDPLGTTIRSGYFSYWSSPHLHLEARSFDDAVRARGGISFSLSIITKKQNSDDPENVKFENIPIEIHSIYPEFLLAKFSKYFYYQFPPFYGLKVRINRQFCILDGGIPHYKIGTVLSRQRFNLNSTNSVYLGIDKIGTLHETNGQFGFFKFDFIKFLLNNSEIRGISLYLANFMPLIKIIPFQKNQFSFKENSIQYLSISL